MPQSETIVVGAGPAGLMAALTAAETGAAVTVLEQLAHPGRKLLASGGGHCNLTNTRSIDEFIAAFGRQGRYILPALEAFGPDHLRAFFNDLGVSTVVEDGIHVFPESRKAATILSALVKRCRSAGVNITTGISVETLTVDENRFTAVQTDGGEICGECCIIATGGKGYPGLGGSETGYRLAAETGHKVIPPVPGLVALITREKWPGKCAGITLPGCSIEIRKRRKIRLNGDLSFTHRGISGPAVIDISAEVSRLLRGEKEVVLLINPKFEEDDWPVAFDRWRDNAGGKQMASQLAQYMPRTLAKELCKAAGVEGESKVAQLQRESRGTLISWLQKGIPLTVADTEGFSQAMVTGGGVALKDVDPGTMRSKLLNNLYFAGEVLDLDGPCGGYNLQWAFSSGRLAGLSSSTRNR